jgi:hypothetical protein
MGARRAVFLPRNAKIRPRTGFLTEIATFFLPAAGSPVYYKVGINVKFSINIIRD